MPVQEYTAFAIKAVNSQVATLSGIREMLLTQSGISSSRMLTSGACSFLTFFMGVVTVAKPVQEYTSFASKP